MGCILIFCVRSKKNSICRFPKIFEDETVGAEAKKLFKEAEVKRFIGYIHKNRQLLPLNITNIKIQTIS